jgi:hypothetical protein
MINMGVKWWTTKATDRGGYVRLPRFFKDCRATEEEEGGEEEEED